jgi:hypothetical protein
MPERHSMRKACSLVLVLACLGLIPAALGQDVTAAITGSVVDPTGANIVGATISTRDTERETTYTVQTNRAGVFQIPRLPIGTYELTVAAPGFQTAVYRSITLVLNQIARVDFQLKIGQANETIDVTSAPPLLHTDTTQLSTVLDSHANVDLPLLSRNYIQLALLAPGSVHPDPQTLTSGDGPWGAGRPYINGNREQANNLVLDGMDNNQVSDNMVGFSPSVDAIQEFSLITQNASAEFGNFQGGVISTSIKSGTNKYHGDIFEFFRNDVLNANNWGNNLQGFPKPALRWNMFGATFGGPVVKNKLFVFVDYQGQRFDHPSTSSPFTLFTAAERKGDFSQLLTEQGIQLYNPFQLDANGNRTTFQNNLIPVSMLDPVAGNLFSSGLYPQPLNGDLTNNFVNTTRSHNNADQGDVRIDYKITPSDRLYLRISEGSQDNPVMNSFSLLFDTFNQARLENGVVNWTHNFSPNVLNEASVGANYVRVARGGNDTNSLGNLGEKLGIANANDHGPGLLALYIFGGAVGYFGSQNIGDAELFADTVFQYKDDVVITHRRHLFHAGFQFWRQRVNTYEAGSSGRTGFMTFSGRFTAGPEQLAVSGGGTGAGEADLFLGLPDSFGRGINSTGRWGQRANVFGIYFQDDWRATDTLTLNLGLRYENHTPWVEVQNRQVNFAPVTGQIQFAGQSCIYSNCRALYNSYNGLMNLQPRIGLAWTPAFLDRRTVLRGAYGISSYLEGTGNNLRLPMNPPFNSPEFETDYFTSNLPDTRTGQGLLPPTTPFQNAIIRLWDANIRPAISQQWNLAVEHQFTHSTTLQVGYVGQHATHLMVALPYLQKQLHADGSITPSPFLSGNATLQSELSQISGTASIGNMRYDALQATLQKRLSDGLQGQIAYTYSKCLTDSIGYFGAGGQAAPASAYWQNLYDRRAEWGPCYYDVTHVLSSYVLYEVPLGRNKRWGRNLNPLANAVMGNWQLGGIVQFHGGSPLTIDAADASGTGSRGSRANCIAPPHVFGRKPASDPFTGQFSGFQWFDPASYAPAVPGTFGTCGVGTVRGPGLHTANLSVQKEFLLSEFKRLEFRAEFFNVTNTLILNSPIIFLSPYLGLINSSQGERNIQFALKLYY